MSENRRCAQLAAVLTVLIVRSHAFADSGSTKTLHYPDQTPRWTYETKRGMPDGLSQLFYEDGAIRVSGHYEEGLKHGLFFFYSTDGKLFERVLYVHGIRRWRSSLAEKHESPPLKWLKELRSKAIASDVHIRTWALPEGPFATMDRISRRLGISVGTSTEDGELSARRAEIFTHIVRGRYGLYLAANQTWIRGFTVGTRGDREQIFNAEQGTVQVAGTWRAFARKHQSITLRLGYLHSSDSAPGDTTPIRGSTGGQRASDFVATFPNARAKRASVSFASSRGYYGMQVDLGIDSMSETIALTSSRDDSLLIRFNAAAAYGHPTWRIAAESSNSHNVSGRSIYTVGATAMYLSEDLSWVMANMMTDQHGEISAVVSFGTWLWRVNQ